MWFLGKTSVKEQRMKLNILGISGSPRHGNSEFLLEKALKAAKNVKPSIISTEVHTFVGKKISPCYSCFKCAEKGYCIVEDDFQDLKASWLHSDAVIYSVPVYHLSIPAQVKAFLDRLGNSVFAPCEHEQIPRFMKVVGVITQGTHIFAGQEHAITNLINHAVIMGCLPVSGDPWESYLGAAGWTHNNPDGKALKKLYEKGDEDAKVSVKAAQSLGKRVSLVTQMLKKGASSMHDILEKYPEYEFFLKPFEDGRRK